MTRLRVASYNIRTGRASDGWDSWPFRRRATAETLTAIDADLAGLQEVLWFQMGFLRGRLPDYETVGTGRGRGNRGEMCPVMVRRASARLLRHRTRWYGDRPDEAGSRLPGASFPRIALTCDVALLAGGEVVQFTNTHLDERDQVNRERSARQLLSWLDSNLPQVVVGDLNARPTNAVLAILAEGGLQSALPPSAGGTYHGFKGRWDGPRIDHVLVSRHFRVERAEVLHPLHRGRPASDHWPVVADLALG